MQHWTECREEREREQTSRVEEMRQLTLKMLPTEDIAAYLSIFERLMKALKIKKEFWTYKLAPQLTGKAQQVFTEPRRQTVLK